MGATTSPSPSCTPASRWRRARRARRTHRRCQRRKRSQCGSGTACRPTGPAWPRFRSPRGTQRHPPQRTTSRGSGCSTRPCRDRSTTSFRHCLSTRKSGRGSGPRGPTRWCSPSQMRAARCTEKASRTRLAAVRKSSSKGPLLPDRGVARHVTSNATRHSPSSSTTMEPSCANIVAGSEPTSDGPFGWITRACPRDGKGAWTDDTSRTLPLCFRRSGRERRSNTTTKRAPPRCDQAHNSFDGEPPREGRLAILRWQSGD
mmetsp:Transcript_14054/g.38403  ORF Transcript_14054/g.38403 Transcript_14054/m.38403 type:complete len:259 (-) Transcript_14054:45-821(-)